MAEKITQDKITEFREYLIGKLEEFNDALTACNEDLMLYRHRLEGKRDGIAMILNKFNSLFKGDRINRMEA